MCSKCDKCGNICNSRTNHTMDKTRYTHRWDQSTYWGRARQFFTTTNTLNLFVTPAQLEQAKVKSAPSRNLESILTSTQDTVVKYKKGELNHLSEDDIWAAKHLYDSAYHPDTGETLLDLWIKIVT